MPPHRRRNPCGGNKFRVNFCEGGGGGGEMVLLVFYKYGFFIEFGDLLSVN